MTKLLLVSALLAGFAFQPADTRRAPRNAAEFDELFQRVKNWGRWGKDDQLGSANLVTPAKRKQALALAKSGTTVSLAHNPLTERAEDNANPFEHTMLRGFSMDRYAVSYHGYAHSHIDALCHILYKDQTYNGYARADVNTEKGCTKLGPWNVGQNAAGLHASVAPWIKERGVAFAGSDLALDVVPSQVEGMTLPVHTLFITALGINLLDNQDLEALAETAAKLNRWEFMLTINPVPVTGGTGFPLNALAMF